MYILVKCDQSVNAGDVISYDSELQKWTPSIDSSKMIAIARTSATEYELSDMTTVYVVEAVISWVCYTRCSASIPDEGGRSSNEL